MRIRAMAGKGTGAIAGARCRQGALRGAAARPGAQHGLWIPATTPGSPGPRLNRRPRALWHAMPGPRGTLVAVLDARVDDDAAERWRMDVPLMGPNPCCGMVRPAFKRQSGKNSQAQLD